jgi:hypothetical protein
MDYNSIKTTSNLPYLELDLEFPYATAMYEISAMPVELFVEHRSDISNGWHQFVMYGTSSDGTRSNWNSPDNRWTKEALEYMPRTVKWFDMNYPSNKFSKIKVALIKPGGGINEHTDGNIKGFATGQNSTVNIAVNNPEGARFHIADTFIPFVAGSSMLIDFSQPHRVVNKSQHNRYHILVGQTDETEEFKTKVIESYQRRT